MKSIGLFGGTFNPVHLGHLRTAVEIKEALNLDVVILIPASLPPHKKPDHMASARDRLEMLRLAVQDNPGFLVSDIELMRSGPSFTIDTVHHFNSLYQNNARLFFIIGSDAFLELDTWKSYIELLKSIPFIVMKRPDHPSAGTDHRFGAFHDFLLEKISPQYRYIETENRYDHPDMPPIYIRNVTPLGISSTKIRELIRMNKSIAYLVPAKVEQYIQTKGLYT